MRRLVLGMMVMATVMISVNVHAEVKKPVGSNKGKPAASKAAIVLPMSDLEGKWKVVSTTWGGDPKDYLGKIYDVKILKDTVSKGDSKGSIDELATQFVALLNSEGDGGLFDFNSIDNQKFCVQQYVNMPNSYSFYSGYPVLGFWRPANYPCGSKKDEEESKDSGSIFPVETSRNFIRIDLKGPGKAHAAIYYEGGMQMLFNKKNTEEILKTMNSDEAVIFSKNTICHEEICHTGSTFWTGVFELELVKVKTGGSAKIKK